MQPKSQINSGYSAHKASAPGAQQLSLTSSTTLLRPCSLRVRSAQAIQPASLSAWSPAAQFDELDYSTQVMQPKSQFSSGYSAHKASAPRSPAAQFDELDYSTQAMQSKSQISSGYSARRPQRLEPSSSV